MSPLSATGIETPALRLLRYALSGALAGIAFVGTVAWIVGHPGHVGYDIAGAVAGFVLVLTVKLMRIA